jgi:hypothetical protein
MSKVNRVWNIFKGPSSSDCDVERYAIIKKLPNYVFNIR